MQSITKRSEQKYSPLSDNAVGQLLRKAWAAREQSAPPFAAQLRAASMQRKAPALAQPTVWVGAVFASLAVAVFMLWPRSPTIADDLALARSVSYQSIWHSQSDSLLVAAAPVSLRGGPALPRASDLPLPATVSVKELL